MTIAYRRTRKEMPADIEEIEAALDEGVRIVELCAPEEVLADGGRVSGLRCRRMRLVPDPDGGRPRPVPTDETFTLGADTLIVSIGQRVKAGFLPDAMTLKADPHTSQTSLPNVFAGGDAVRGAATLINAVADGRHAAETILARLGLSAQAATATPSDERRPDLDGLRIRQATRVMGPALPERSPEDRLDFDPAIRTLTEEEAMDESRRCLQCDLVCNVCTTVCPNRANVALLSLPMPHPVQVAVRDGDGVRVETLSNRRLEQSYQIVNIADACNECGNCATFCPSAGAPYRDKPPYPPVPRILRQRAGRLPARQSVAAGRQARRQGLLAGCGKGRLRLRKRCPHRPSRRRNPLRHQGYAERRRQRGRPVRRGGGRHPLPPVGPQAAFRRAEAQIGSSTGPRHPGIRSSPRMPRVLPHYGPRHPQTACPGTASAKKSTRHKEKFIDSTICFY